ncbi:oviduct-specific glycoprotein-like [Otolemur garnettii]|uniref:oviduct-specific glycoprotein-like n=1 Tax=Otolemur garnettii TaxID=30611 RepID=UPI0006444CA8|nr:oviduct-specific glycoprotein-like [Otolemur garnettii]
MDVAFTSSQPLRMGCRLKRWDQHLQGTEKHWIDYQRVPYANKGKEWVGYDDVSSFIYKAWFVKREHFGGAMVWTLDTDDVKGTICGAGPFPLVYVLNHILVRDVEAALAFWLSSAMNSSSVDPERLTMTKFLPAGGEALGTKIHGIYENMTTIPTGGMVTPGRETISLGKHIVTLGEKTEIPEGKTVTSVDYQSVTSGGLTIDLVYLQTESCGEKTITPVGYQSVTPGRMTMTPVPVQTETLRETTLAPRRKTMAPEKVPVSPPPKDVSPL